MAKRLFDIIFGVLALAIASPVMLFIAVRLKIDDGGPVFYRGRRVGRHGVPFFMLKFRTMVIDAERRGGPSTAADDPRITGVGLLLRRYKLDELPQLVNVVRGDMSFVGPRPEVEKYVAMFTEEERAILTVRPGITDWASLWNSDEGALLAGSSDPERTYLEIIRPHKVRLQLAYVRRQSFTTDLRIIAETIAAVVLRRPAPAVAARQQER